MTDFPRIAIVTPSFNAGTHIGAAIDSVLAQNYPSLDYLVMDGGSTDNTLEVLRSYGDRIRWISHQDDGQADALRRGFAQTTGDILGWLNADDTFEPGALHVVAQFFADHPDVSLVYGDATYIDARGRLIGPCAHIEPYSRNRLFYYSDYIVQPAAFFRRSAYDAVGGIDPSLHYGMDYDLWLKLAGQGRIAYLPRRLANYRWLTDNKTAIGGFARVNELAALLKRHGLGEPAFIRLERVNLHLRDSISSLRQRKVASSIASLTRAVGIVFSSPRALWSLFQPRTWRVIWMGQVLRTRAARAAQKTTAGASTAQRPGSY
jgi:glycosyltransferase involved in cell wall biosynthesis